MRSHPIGLALLAAATVAVWVAWGRDDDYHPGGWVKGGWTNDPAVLCIYGRPAPRRPDVTYGGLPTQACCQRNHIVPLGLGGPDTLYNLEYEPWPEARVDDERERQAERLYCNNPSPQLLEELRGQFKREWP